LVLRPSRPPRPRPNLRPAACPARPARSRLPRRYPPHHRHRLNLAMVYRPDRFLRPARRRGIRRPKRSLRLVIRLLLLRRRWTLAAHQDHRPPRRHPHGLGRPTRARRAGTLARRRAHRPPV
jgi:hypothetical protein